MDITPGSISEVRRALGGSMIEIAPDVAEFAQRLKEIDPSLRLRHSDAQGVFVIFEVRDLPDGSQDEHLVTTARELNKALLDRMLEISDPNYDFIAELERLEDQSERDTEHDFRERTGETAQRLRHAMRRDLGINQDRVFVPGKEKA